MKFAFIPRDNYRIGQIIKVHGKRMSVVSYSHTGKNVEVVSLPIAKKFERVLCICTDNKPIDAVTA